MKNPRQFTLDVFVLAVAAAGMHDVRRLQFRLVLFALVGHDDVNIPPAVALRSPIAVKLIACVDTMCHR
jgi:hypothetical protein